VVHFKADFKRRYVRLTKLRVRAVAIYVRNILLSGVIERREERQQATQPLRRLIALHQGCRTNEELGRRTISFNAGDEAENRWIGSRSPGLLVDWYGRVNDEFASGDGTANTVNRLAHELSYLNTTETSA
jgi:hypothetical protein